MTLKFFIALDFTIQQSKLSSVNNYCSMLSFMNILTKFDHILEASTSNSMGKNINAIFLTYNKLHHVHRFIIYQVHITMQFFSKTALYALTSTSKKLKTQSNSSLPRLWVDLHIMCNSRAKEIIRYWSKVVPVTFKNLQTYRNMSQVYYLSEMPLYNIKV